MLNPILLSFVLLFSAFRAIASEPAADEMVEFKYRPSGQEELVTVAVPYFKDPAKVKADQKYGAFESYTYAKSGETPIALVQLGSRAVRANLPKGHPLAVEKTKVIFGIYLPENHNGSKLPLVVLLPGSSGESNFEIQFSKFLNQKGYGVLVMHSNASRGLHGSSSKNQMAVSLYANVSDALILGNYAKGLSFVAADNINLIGDSYGGVVALQCADDAILRHFCRGQSPYHRIASVGGLPIIQFKDTRFTTMAKVGVFHALKDEWNKFAAVESLVNRHRDAEGELPDHVKLRVYSSGGHNFQHFPHADKAEGVVVRHPEAQNLSERCMYLHATLNQMDPGVSIDLTDPSQLMPVMGDIMANTTFSVLVDHQVPAEGATLLSKDQIGNDPTRLVGTSVALADMIAAYFNVPVPKGTATWMSKSAREQFLYDIEGFLGDRY
ncbi:MAG: hypothetical protein ACK5O7_01160 [Holosporales bacterium]